MGPLIDAYFTDSETRTGKRLDALLNVTDAVIEQITDTEDSGSEVLSPVRDLTRKSEQAVLLELRLSRPSPSLCRCPTGESLDSGWKNPLASLGVLSAVTSRWMPGI